MSVLSYLWPILAVWTLVFASVTPLVIREYRRDRQDARDHAARRSQLRDELAARRDLRHRSADVSNVVPLRPRPVTSLPVAPAGDPEFSPGLDGAA